MINDPFDFATWLSESISTASRSVITRAIHTLAQHSYNSDLFVFTHNFYISFITKDKDVVISESLRKQYPESMTIVLEHQFQNLKPKEFGFGVTLGFDGVLHDLYIPYEAIIYFRDPSIKLDIPILYDNKRLLLQSKSTKLTNEKSEKNKNIKEKDSNIIEFKRPQD